MDQKTNSIIGENGIEINRNCKAEVKGNRLFIEVSLDGEPTLSESGKQLMWVCTGRHGTALPKGVNLSITVGKWANQR